MQKPLQDALNEQPRDDVQTEVYLLQMDPCISIGSAESQVIPLQMLDNSYQEFIHEQYIVPFQQTRNREEHENVQVFFNTHNDTSKIINVDAEKNLHIKKEYVAPHMPCDLSHYAVSSKAILDNNSSKAAIEKEIRGTIKVEQYKLQSYVHISDRSVAPRAVAVLPGALQLRGNVVVPRRQLPPRVRFGPVVGVRLRISHSMANELIAKSASANSPLYLLKQKDGNYSHIDVTDKDKSNWFSFLPLGDRSTSNVWLYEENNELYGITMESIPSRKPLAIGYSKMYAEGHGLPDGQPVLHLSEECSVGANRWWCHECRRPMATAALLQQHMDLHIKENRSAPRHRYRCKQCTRTFCRLFTLKRHMTRHCTKKPENTIETSNTEAATDISLNCTQTTEDNRIPSDESFQNYTNGLDFSTNLFDDRMPSLDISGNSRSECEFNLCAMSSKDENVLTGELELSKFSDGLGISQNPVEKKKEPVKPLPVTCPYCNQALAKEKRRRHVRVCPARRFECECGRVFTNKRTLTEHIYTEHRTNFTSKSNSNTSNEKKSYSCDKCKYKFKRRGMLVNHLWRVHRAAPAAVPLEKRVLLYLCVACPKTYRSAAKRNHHVRVHHPGAEKLRAQTIEGGVRAYEPAACAACPRQYATRAKLLQHVRKDHPHLEMKS